MVSSDKLLRPGRIKVKIASYFVSELTLPPLCEIHGEILSKPVVIHLNKCRELKNKESKI